MAGSSDTGTTSSLASLLALLSSQGTQGQGGAPLAQNPQAFAALMSMMGGPSPGPMSAYQMPMPPQQNGVPMAPFTPTPVQNRTMMPPAAAPMAMQGGAPQGQNMMAMLAQMDPATRAQLLQMLMSGMSQGQPMPPMNSNVSQAPAIAGVRG
jgi:hypothetical protein